MRKVIRGSWSQARGVPRVRKVIRGFLVPKARKGRGAKLAPKARGANGGRREKRVIPLSMRILPQNS